MLEGNTLRGGLVNTNEGKGSLGFKGERGYSNYELYVLSGGSMTEEEWLEHFGVDLTGYIKTADIIDDLVTSYADRPLSAKQGKNLKDSVDGLTSDKINTSDIADNLTTNNSTKVLSAKQGKILKDTVDTTNTNIGTLSSLNTNTKANLVGAINEVNSQGVYSTTETVVGKWVDNKPIYRQVFTQTNTNTIGSVAANNDTIVKMECLIKRTGSNTWRVVPWLFANNSAYGNYAWAGGYYFSNGNVVFQLGSDLGNIDKLVFIIEYTKTTD